LNSESSYKDSNDNLLKAIEVLENAQNQSKKESTAENKNESFWNKVGSLFNPFRCGKDNK